MAFSARTGNALRIVIVGSALSLAAACEDGFDYDVRSEFGSDLDTSDAARTATAQRPKPDKRGIISYPNYQVAVARRGDTLNDVANRIGMPVADLAGYNGIRPEDNLRQGEVIALPYRVSEPSKATGGTGVVTPPDVDIAALAGDAINSSSANAPRVDSEPLQPAPANAPKGETGYEPIRHKVKRGETAFTISRLYNVTPRALAEWNGLDSDFTIRENQILLIPPAEPPKPGSTAATTTTAAAGTTAPGQGTPTPTPPSATKPLPGPDEEVVVPQSPDLGESQTSRAQMEYPVNGNIIRPYSKGKNNGVDISADPGSPVVAATNGDVAAITTDQDNIQILVLRHDGNLMTVYYNVDNVAVKKGAKVKRGQTIAKVPSKDNFVHFEVRKGFDSVDPMPYLK